jgi:hypothetical protein
MTGASPQKNAATVTLRRFDQGDYLSPIMIDSIIVAPCVTIVSTDVTDGASNRQPRARQADRHGSSS